MQRFKKKKTNIWSEEYYHFISIHHRKHQPCRVHLKILEYLWSKYNKKTEIVLGKHFFILFFSFSLILFCLFGFLILRDRKKACEVGGDGKCLGGVWEGDTVIKIYFMIFFSKKFFK